MFIFKMFHQEASVETIELTGKIDTNNQTIFDSSILVNPLP